MEANGNAKEAVIAIQGNSAKNEAAQEVTMETSKEETPVQNFLGPLTIFTFLLSLPILALVIWLQCMRDYDCEDLLRLPRLRIGIELGTILVFVVSNAVVFCRSKFPIPGLLVVMVPLIFMLTVGLGLVGAYKMESRAIPGSPMWLKLKIHNNENWPNIKSCIYDNDICDDLVARTFAFKPYDFGLTKLSSIESGCCKPPILCGMEYVNATFWNKEENGGVLEQSYPYDSDCESWNNDENKLCYDCNACREGFLSTLRSKWFRLGIFLVVMAILLIMAHLLMFLATMWEQYRT